MDYEFSTQFGEVTATFSMGHEAIGRWLTEELGSQLKKTDYLLAQVTEIEEGHRQQLAIVGANLQLDADRYGVSLTPVNDDTSLDSEDEDENAALYDQEFRAECGLTDFIEALASWRNYVAAL